MSIRPSVTLGAAALLLVSVQTATADTYPPDLFSVSMLHIDVTRQPQGIQDFLHDTTVQGLLDTVAASYGVNPVYVNLALDAVPGTQSSPSVTNYGLPVPSGYAFCAATVTVYGILPSSPSGGTQIAAGNRGNGAVLAVQVRTPQGGWGSGKANVNADVEMVSIKQEYLQEFQQQGICRGPTDDAGYIIRCRGNPCPSVTWGDMAALGQKFPALAQGR